tara:strand:- start:147 stop:347 length:201 start_codon:yes stop_codon:yes gene_type:complete
MKHCRVCSFIRYFLAFVLLIIIVALTFQDNLAYLSFINPWNTAILIFIAGILLFIFKLIEYLNEKD